MRRPLRKAGYGLFFAVLGAVAALVAHLAKRWLGDDASFAIVYVGLLMAGLALMVLAMALPAALPEIFTGFRIGFSLTLLGTLIGELFASDRGIGFVLIRGMEHGDAPTIVALTFMLFAISAFAGWILLRINRRLRHYQQSHAAAV